MVVALLACFWRSLCCDTVALSAPGNVYIGGVRFLWAGFLSLPGSGRGNIDMNAEDQHKELKVHYIFN